jgi:hypothetical protein
VLARVAVARGPWLDEFWSIWAITPAAAPSSLVERWLGDVHTLVWPAWTWAVATLGGDGLPVRRLLANGGALMLLGAGSAVLARARPSNRPFLALLLVSVLGTPMVALSFGDYRPYFAHVCAFALLVACWAHIQSAAPGEDEGDGAGVRVVLVAATFLSIAFHYIATLIASLAVGLFLVILWRQGRRRWALWMGGAAGAGWLFLLVSLALQYPRWQAYLDVRWIGTRPDQALLLELSMLAFPFYLTPAMVVLAAAGWRLNQGAGRELRQVTWPLLAAAALSAGLLFVLNFRTPILVDRYMLLWNPLVCGAAAALAAPLARDRWLAPLVVLMLLVAGYRTLGLLDRVPGWTDGAARVAELVRACPGTRVYWMSTWQLSPTRHSRAGRRELQAFGLGYARQAKRFGFVARPLPEDSVIDVRGATCPTLVWMEHALASDFGRVRDLTDMAQLRIVGPRPGQRLRLLQRRAAKILVIPAPR